MMLGVALLPGLMVPGLGVLLLLWALNGAGQALVAIPSLGLLADHTQPEERGRGYAAHFALTHLFWLFTYPAADQGLMMRSTGRPFTFSSGR
jgi:MFS transporter, NRE family, putaive nickel resistance protein